MSVASEPHVSDLFTHLRSYSRELFALDRRPLIDQTFSFPWNDFGAEFKKIFDIDLALSPQEFGWKEKDDLFQGLVAPVIPIALSIPGINGQILLLISRSDIERLMAHILHVDMATLLKQEPSFFDQFQLFFTTELVACAHQIPSLKAIVPRITTRQETESAGSLCQDIKVQLLGETALARLVVPPEFLESWRTLRMGDEPKASPSLRSEIDVHISVEAGRTFLTAQEIGSLENGDFLLIDHPFYIPNSPKARVFLTHNGHPLFRAKVQEGNVKILEMPLQHEAFLPLGGHSMSMKELNPQKRIRPQPGESPEDDLPADSQPQNPARGASSRDQASSEENPFEGEEAEEQEETAIPMTEEEAQQATQMSGNLAKEPVTIDQLPLTIIVELTELTMSIDQLTALQPGNLLDLDIRPENGVMLVVNGKIFGQGELVRIGDNVGVRIKETIFSQHAASHA